jgi:hypothetical protein
MKLNITKNNILIMLLLTSGQLGFSQGFQNMDFESAQIIPLTQGADFPPYSVATTNAVPGWAEVDPIF